MQTDTELQKLEESEEEQKEQKLKILNDYNIYLTFMEKLFYNKKSTTFKDWERINKTDFWLMLELQYIEFLHLLHY